MKQTKPHWMRCLSIYRNIVKAAKIAPYQTTDLNEEGLAVLDYLTQLANEHGHLLRVNVYTTLGIVSLSNRDRITGEVQS